MLEFTYFKTRNINYRVPVITDYKSRSVVVNYHYGYGESYYRHEPLHPDLSTGDYYPYTSTYLLNLDNSFAHVIQNEKYQLMFSPSHFWDGIDIVDIVQNNSINRPFTINFAQTGTIDSSLVLKIGDVFVFDRAIGIGHYEEEGIASIVGLEGFGTYVGSNGSQHFKGIIVDETWTIYKNSRYCKNLTLEITEVSGIVGRHSFYNVRYFTGQLVFVLNPLQILYGDIYPGNYRLNYNEVYINRVVDNNNNASDLYSGTGISNQSELYSYINSLDRIESYKMVINKNGTISFSIVPRTFKISSQQKKIIKRGIGYDKSSNGSDLVVALTDVPFW